jgi:putative effector of murein hydrolase
MTAAEVVRSIVFLGATSIAYAVATRLHETARRHPLSNVVLVAVLLVSAALWATSASFPEYTSGTRPLTMLLGPATVALALPLHRSMGDLRASTRPVLLGVLVAVAVATSSAVGLARVLGLSRETTLSIAPKTTTTPIAMAVAERLGGSPGLATLFVMVTGIFGALVVPTAFDLMRVRDPRARGLALGIAAHGVGTARALQLGPLEAGFAALGMGLSGIVTPVLAPLVVEMLVR